MEGEREKTSQLAFGYFRFFIVVVVVVVVVSFAKSKIVELGVCAARTRVCMCEKERRE